MNWNIFSPGKRARRRGTPKDRFDGFVDVIETFAPREYLSQREIFYYNYKMMASSRESLQGLLENLSRKERLKNEPGEHGRALFLQLKKFYDPKDTLSVSEALADKNLIRRFRDLFIFFYGREKLSLAEIKSWLKPLKRV
jgi:hypothetical protein